jgi:hypothetical protein
MTRLTAQGIALVLMLLSLPLISIGSTQGIAALWWPGLLALVVGGLIPPTTRFALPRENG